MRDLHQKEQWLLGLCLLGTRYQLQAQAAEHRREHSDSRIDQLWSQMFRHILHRA